MITLVTFLYGFFVTCLGIVSYFATGQVSKTALIPCVFGLPVVALAIAAWLKTSMTRKSAIAATVIAILALGGTVRSLGGFITLITGGEIARSSAVIAQGIMAIASFCYIVYFVATSLTKDNRHKS